MANWQSSETSSNPRNIEWHISGNRCGYRQGKRQRLTAVTLNTINKFLYDGTHDFLSFLVAFRVSNCVSIFLLLPHLSIFAVDILLWGVCIITAGMNYTSLQPGSSGGLSVVLHVNQKDYLRAVSSSAGFRVN